MATTALSVAIYRACSADVCAELVSSGARVVQCLSVMVQQRPLGPDCDSMRHIAKYLCSLPAMAMHPALVLRTGIAALLPEMVRSSLEAGLAQWKMKRATSFPRAQYTICDWCRYFGGILHRDLRRERTPHPVEIDIIRAVFSHPSFTLEESLGAGANFLQPHGCQSFSPPTSRPTLCQRRS